MTPQAQNILRSVIFGGILLVPLIPFIVANDMFFPFITGKGFIFRILIEVLLGMWAVLAYWNPAFRPKLSGALYAVVAFVGVMAVADFFGENAYKSFWSNYERMEGLVLLLHLMGYTFLTVSILNTEKRWEKWFKVSLGASALMAVYGLFQLWGLFEIHQGSTRLDGTFGNSAYMAVYMLFHIFIAAYFWVKEYALIHMRILYTALILFNTIILYFTATRGAILGFIGGAILTALLVAFVPHDEKKHKRVAVGVLLAIVLSLTAFMFAKDSSFVAESPVLSRFASISLEETTTQSRFLIWSMAIEGFKEHPILGWGQESFNFVFNKYYDPALYAQEQWFDRAHNVFLDWLIAGGILGLLSYLGLFSVTLYLLWFKVGTMSVTRKSIFTGMLAGYFIHNIFVFDNLMSYIMFFSFIAYVHTLSRDSQEKEIDANGDELEEKAGPYDALVLPLAIVVVVVSMYGFNYKAVAANYALIEGMRLAPETLGYNIFKIKESLRYDSFGTQEGVEQLPRLAGRIAAVPGIMEEPLEDFFTFVERELLDQIRRVPGDTRHEFFAGVYYGGRGNLDKAQLHIERALALSPTKQSLMFELVKIHNKKGEKEEALALAEHAYNLAPDFKTALLLYVSTAYEVGNGELVAELIDKLGPDALRDDAGVFSMYLEKLDYQKLLEIWLLRMDHQPDVLQPYIGASAAHLGLNQPYKAIELLRQAMELATPKQVELYEYYISEIYAGRDPSQPEN